MREVTTPEPAAPADEEVAALDAHWGTCPGFNLVHTHLNRVIRARGQDALCVWARATETRRCWRTSGWRVRTPRPTRTSSGMARPFRQFSFPGGVPSHVAPETPGSIHEGGELGFALSHAHVAARLWAGQRPADEKGR